MSKFDDVEKIPACGKWGQIKGSKKKFCFCTGYDSLVNTDNIESGSLENGWFCGPNAL